MYSCKFCASSSQQSYHDEEDRRQEQRKANEARRRLEEQEEEKRRIELDRSRREEEQMRSEEHRKLHKLEEALKNWNEIKRRTEVELEACSPPKSFNPEPPMSTGFFTSLSETLEETSQRKARGRSSKPTTHQPTEESNFQKAECFKVQNICEL